MLHVFCFCNTEIIIALNNMSGVDEIGTLTLVVTSRVLTHETAATTTFFLAMQILIEGGMHLQFLKSL